MADYRSLEIKTKHARELKNVNLLSKMDPYVVVFISSDPNTKHKTPVDRTGNKNPTWGSSAKFAVDVAAARRVRPTLVFAILCERALGDKPIGEVHVPLADLLNTLEDGKPFHVAYQVREPSGRAKGELNFSYQWGEKLAGAQPPATAPLLPVAGKVEEPIAAYPVVAGTSSGFYLTEPVPEKVDDPATAYPIGPGTSSGFYPPVPGYGPYGPHQPAPLGGYEQPYPPVASYACYPPPYQYGGYPSPPDQRYGYQAEAGYGYSRFY